MHKLKRTQSLRANIDYTGLGLFIILFLLGILLTILSPYFLTLNNIFNILLSVTVIGISAVGGTLVILSGGLDLSVESIIACTGVIIAILNQRGFPIALSIFIGFLTGPIFGLIMGLLIAKAKINSVIVTLAMLTIIRGIALLLTNAKTISLRYTNIGIITSGKIFNKIPISIIILLAIFFIFFFILNFTPFGRNIYSVGGNPTASLLAGINIEKYRIIVYVIAGSLSALSGVLFASMTGAGLPYGASGYSLTVITAVILGGISLAGGSGKIMGTFLGVLIIGVLNNGLVLLSITTFLQMIITGLVLIIAVAVEKINLTNR